MCQIRSVKMDNLRSLLSVRRKDKLPNARIKLLCRVTKRMDKRTNENFLKWFGQIERRVNGGIAKTVYVREHVGRCLVGRPQKRRIDSVKLILKKCLNVGQARRMVYDMNEWPGFVRS